MPQRASDQATVRFELAERRLFAACGVQVASRRVRLADPPVAARVLEAGDGPPLVLDPMAWVARCRVDLPG